MQTLLPGETREKKRAALLSVGSALLLVSLKAFLVALSIDITRAKKLAHVAAKYSSEALEADALHFSTDVWSTIVVILGIGLVWAGEKWHLPWLAFADA